MDRGRRALFLGGYDDHRRVRRFGADVERQPLLHVLLHALRRRLHLHADAGRRQDAAREDREPCGRRPRAPSGARTGGARARGLLPLREQPRRRGRKPRREPGARRPAARVTAEDPWRNAPGGAGDEAVARGRDGREPTGARYDARRLGRVPPRLGGDGPLEGVDARQGLAARALPEAAGADRRRCRAHGHVPPGVPHGGRVSLLPEEFNLLAAPRLRRPPHRRRHLRLRGGDRRSRQRRRAPPLERPAVARRADVVRRAVCARLLLLLGLADDGGVWRCHAALAGGAGVGVPLPLRLRRVDRRGRRQAVDAEGGSDAQAPDARDAPHAGA